VFAVILKGVLIFFILMGIPIALYGAWEVWGTVSWVKTSPVRGKATFEGYHREVHESSTIPSSPHMSSGGIESSHSEALYPEFSYRAEDGSLQRVRESKVHVVERYKPGDEVEILVSPHGIPRLADFYSLYGRDLLILAIGLGFILLPLVIWKGFIPVVETTPEGAAFAAFWNNVISDVGKMIRELKIGPIPFSYILYFFGGLMALVFLISIINGLAPFVAQMRLGAGARLIGALEERRFDEAGEMIVAGKGIRATNEYGQNALLLALEAEKPDLARRLIEAGADVNIRSKMNQSPLQIAVRSGDLEMVKLLLVHGALPHAPEDEFPIFFLAVAKGHEEIARALVEAGTDLHRSYRIKDFTVTVGDYAVLAKKPALAEFIRQKGGSFTQKEDTSAEVKLGEEIDRDGRFVAYSLNVVVDEKTGLMWADRDNGADINWHDAVRYCKDFAGAGYTDWRMPTIRELQGIQGTGETYPLECKPSSSAKLTRLVKLTCSCLWTSEEEGSEAYYVSFKDGTVWRFDKSNRRYQRILPVRTYK